MRPDRAEVEARLAHRGLKLPQPPRPAGRYAPWMMANGLLFISGQVPLRDGRVEFRGRVGAELSEEEGTEAARLAALNVLAQIDAALEGFDRLAMLLRVEGHVSSASDFIDQPRILDGASEVFHVALGHRAGHARAAFAHTRLPLDAAVELVVTAAVK
jgi:enamine deaminase RidA (YjgF/YER057c/UK114 family)